MHRNKSHLFLGLIALLLASLSCSTLMGGGDAAGSAPTSDGAGDSASGGVEIRQWAATALASSEYGSSDWSARQATGAPNTFECGDHSTAWASSSPSGQDWLEIGFNTAVIPTQINIEQTNSPGSIVEVEVKDTSGKYSTVYTAGPAPMQACPFILSITVSGITAPVNAVRITVDQSVIQDWNEIDAVELIGRQ